MMRFYVLLICLALIQAFTARVSAQEDLLDRSIVFTSSTYTLHDTPFPLPEDKDIDERNPWIAFAMSAIVTGGGQVYNKQYYKGVAQFSIATVGLGLLLADNVDKDEPVGAKVDSDDSDRRGTIGAVLYLGSALWSMIDAPVSANAINRKRRETAHFHIAPMVRDDRIGAQVTLSF